MKKIRILKVSFNAIIKGSEVPAFRGAVANMTGKDSILFHNHLENGRYNYNYPLIQYKAIARQPVIMCLEEGVNEIHHYFQNEVRDIEVSGRKLDMSIDELRLNSFTMQVWDKYWTYSLQNWVALNQQNYEKYQETESEQDRINMLVRVLKGNILSFAKGINWYVDKQINVKILEINNIHTVKLKKNHLMGFSILFKANVFIPNYLGLGKGVSHGYGIVREIKN